MENDLLFFFVLGCEFGGIFTLGLLCPLSRLGPYVI